MFKSKTVFIVGAGASCEAGLPGGEEIKKNIADLLDFRFSYGRGQESGDRQIYQALEGHVALPSGQYGDTNPYIDACRTIRGVVEAAISIDNLLDAHQGDEKIELCGKLAIVKSILDAESRSQLRSETIGSENFKLRDLLGTWYVGFLRMLTEGVRKNDAENIFDNVTIITFNYDRCIERFLPQALAEYYDIQLEKAENIVKKLKIIHPYGKVGNLHWQNYNDAVSFGRIGASLLPISKQIRTFAEGLRNPDLVKEIHNALLAAETLVFLGFAFHPANLELLSPKKTSKVSRVFATTLGLSDADEQIVSRSVTQMLRPKGDASAEPLRLVLARMQCTEFFRQHFRSLSAEG